MPLSHPTLETVPFEEIAEILSRAASRVPGGPPALIDVSGRQLAAALDAAGFKVVRDAAPGPQLSLWRDGLLPTSPDHFGRLPQMRWSKPLPMPSGSTVKRRLRFPGR